MLNGGEVREPQGIELLNRSFAIFQLTAADIHEKPVLGESFGYFQANALVSAGY